MRIKLLPFSPCVVGATLSVIKAGDRLTLNGQELDFSALPDGATLPAGAVACEWVSGPVERVDGQLVITLRLPHAADASELARFPVDIVNPPNGEVRLPV